MMGLREDIKGLVAAHASSDYAIELKGATPIDVHN